MNKKQLKRAYGTIDELNRAISSNEERIMEINKNIELAKANYDAHTVVGLEDIKRKYKANSRRLRQSKKEIMQAMTVYAEEIDKNTKNTQSNIPVTREYLQANYRITNTFNGVSLNSINDNLPVRLSNKALSKLVLEVFPDVQERKCTNDIKYNMEMII